MYKAISKFSGMTIKEGTAKEISQYCKRFGIERKDYKLQKVK